MTKSSAIPIVLLVLCTVVGSLAQSPPSSSSPGASQGQSQPKETAVNSVVPKAPNVLQRRPEAKKHVCSIPLLQKEIDPDKDFKIYQVRPPRIDDAFVLKPSAPSCKSPAVVPSPSVNGTQNAVPKPRR